jgi:hypothetical protein
MGSQGTMLVNEEQDIMIFPTAGRPLSVTVSQTGKGLTALDASASSDLAQRKAGETGQAALGSGPISRGYREEMEDFAYCVRLWNQGDKKDRRLPRCHGRVAMADAIVALTSNQAMRQKQRIEFKHEWFDPASSEVPDPDMKAEAITS